MTDVQLQPLDEKFPIVGPDGRPTLYFIKWAQQRQIDIIEVSVVATGAVNSAKWGFITGILTDQEDLQDALDAKLNVLNPSGIETLDIISPDGFKYFGMRAQDDGLGANIVGVNQEGGTHFWRLGYIDLITNRVIFEASIGYDGIQFDAPPYVVNDEIYYAGNLIFGAGLSYDSGTKILSATGGGSGGVLPVVDGSIPPVFLQNPDGSLIYTEI